MQFPWEGLCVIGVGTFFALVSRAQGAEAAALASVPSVGSIEDLAKEPLPRVLAVSGFAGADAPLHARIPGVTSAAVVSSAGSSASPGPPLNAAADALSAATQAVLVEEKLQSHILRKTETGDWVRANGSFEVSTRREAPHWFLSSSAPRPAESADASAAASRIYVLQSAEASGLQLQHSSTEFEPAQSGIIKV